MKAADQHVRSQIVVAPSPPKKKHLAIAHIRMLSFSHCQEVAKYI